MSSSPLGAVERITAAQSEQEQRRVAGGLRELGLRTGDRIAIVAAPSSAYLAATLGALRSGIVPVILNATLTEREQSVLLDHPAVYYAAVFGVADERWGERVCAAVVTEIEVAELDSWLRSRIAPYKRPKSIVPVDAIPVTSTGKVRRVELGAALGFQE